MNKWLSIICLSTLSISCYAEQITLNSTIKAVTIYADRAAITRQAQISLPAGEYQVSFVNLPNDLDDNSVQLNAEATAPTTILDLTTSASYQQYNINDRLQTINKQITTLQQQLNDLTDQETLLTNQQTFIQKAQAVILAPSKDASRPTANELKNILQLSKDKLSQILAQQREVTKQRSELKNQLSVLRSQLDPLQNNGHAIKNVVVRLNLVKPANVKLNLTYTTLGASWYPLYDARYNSKTKQLILNYFGVIRQKTGEDWHQIKLTLSTAKPAISGNPPTLSNWLIDELKPLPIAAASSVADAAKMMDAAPRPLTNIRRAKDIEALTKMASVDSSITSASFNIDKPTSLISGKPQQKVAITSIKLTSELHYITVPRLAQTAYLQAKTTNTSNFPLLTGKLNSFMDNKFISTSQLATTMPNGELKLDLGADEAIAVNFKQLRRYTEKTGFTSSSEKVTYEYLITVKNNKATPEHINVLDHIPVSQDEQISVKLLSPNANKDKQFNQDKEGQINWTWTLQPSEKKEATLSFSVEYPVGIEVTGLPQ